MAYEHKNEHAYRKALSKRKHAVLCHRCGDVLASTAFEEHVAEEHGAPAGCCVWCDQIAGTRGEKLESIPLKPSDPSSHFARPDYLRLPLFQTKPPLFKDRNLDLARKCLLAFLDRRETRAWYHATVTVLAVPRFFQALREDEGHTRMLKFTCWCDAGKHRNPEHRQHQHLIVASPADHFERHVWPKVTDAPDAARKTLQRIASPMQLLDLLGSLGGRASTCEKGAWQDGDEHHFNIGLSLPSHHRLPLALLWDGGLEQFLHAEAFQNADLARVMELPLLWVDGKWRLRVKHFPNLNKNQVMPVSKDMKPTRERGQAKPLHTFHLLEGKKLYFYHAPVMRLLGPREWLRAQAAGGNSFFENVGEALWTPRDQETLSRWIFLTEGTERHAEEGTTEGPRKRRRTALGIRQV